jgi:hypothetical protein
MADIEITTRPRRLSEVREDMRTLCHIAVPASGNLRDLAKHLSRELPPTMEGDGFTHDAAEGRTAELVKEIGKLADATAEVAKYGQRVLDQLEGIRNSRARVNRGTSGDGIDI